MINTKKVLRNLLTLAVAGLGLTVAPGTAYADFLDFTVVESVVPGSPLGPTFVADDINGKYRETLTLTPSAGPCAPGQLACGTFSATALATFGQYFANEGTTLIPASLIGDAEPDGYTILGTFDSVGTYFDTLCGPVPCRIFTGTSATGALYLDDEQNGNFAGDIQIATASNLQPGSGGILFTGTNPPTGSFNLVFGTVDVLFDAYWPTLALLQVTATANGDFDSVVGANVQTITGDVDIRFAQVPEPATLTMLGLGLAGVARLRKRRQAKNAIV